MRGWALLGMISGVIAAIFLVLWLVARRHERLTGGYDDGGRLEAVSDIDHGLDDLNHHAP
jgi:hypothetical protein